MKPGDADIVRASVDRPEAFEAIFDRHHQRIWTYLARSGGRERADELAGDVFVAAFAQRGRFDPARGSVVGWLYGIAANVARSRFRREARAARALARVAAVAGTSGPSPMDEAVAAVGGGQQLARVFAAMDALSERDRELIVLAAWEELSYVEIATVVGVEVGTVRSRLSRARRRLRALAGPDGEDREDTDGGRTTNG